MNDADRFKLLHGPYRTPRCQVGDWLRCRVRGTVQVVELSDAPIIWPLTLSGTRRVPVVCCGLLRAVRTESEVAVCHWWRLSVYMVGKLRRALNVPANTEGTNRLRSAWSELNAEETLAAARAAPHRAERIAEAKRGQPRPPGVMDAAHAANRGRKASADTRARMSQAAKARGSYPPAAGRPFTAAEDALLGTMTDADLGELLGRPMKSIHKRRKKLGIPSWRSGRAAT